MKKWHVVAAALVSSVWVSVVSADELKSGVAAGGAITSYKATKSGGIQDGVRVGTPLCYT